MTDEVLLDRDVVARIISRASELSGPVLSLDGHGGIGEAALLAAADEVGLSVVAVRRSIAMERLGPPPVAKLSDRVLGASMLIVDGEIVGTIEDVLARMDIWMVNGHHLRRDRLRADRGEWSRRSGVVGLTVRHLRTATGEGRLGGLHKVTAAANDTGTGSIVVRVSVDRGNDRRMAAASGAIVAVGGTGGLIVAAIALTPAIILATPVIVLGGVGVALTGRNRANRTTAEVERLLESVADHNDPTRLRAAIAQRVIGRNRTKKRQSSAPEPR